MDYLTRCQVVKLTDWLTYCVGVKFMIDSMLLLVMLYGWKYYFLLLLSTLLRTSDCLKVRKETWVPSDLPDPPEDQEPQEGLVVLDIKVFT